MSVVEERRDHILIIRIERETKRNAIDRATARLLGHIDALAKTAVLAPDLRVRAALQGGTKAGTVAGTKTGKKQGYDAGYKKGYRTSYKAAYEKAKRGD